MKQFRFTVGQTGLALILWGVGASAHTQPEPERVQAVQPASAAQLETKKPRLKFRSGSVCMCSTGTSEKEISEAMARRKLERIESNGDTGR
ncbi:MAG: hypothetical protein ACFCUJ_01090 [Thiotrichales bacterium]